MSADFGKVVGEKWQALKVFFGEHKDWLTSITLTFVSALFFLVVSNPEFSKGIFSIKRRYVLSFLIIFQFLLTYLICYLSKWKTFKSISVWIQSNALAIFSFAYYVRLNKSDLKIGDLDVSTQMSVIVIGLLTFLVNYNLFGEYKSKFFLKAAQVFLYPLAIFSLLNVSVVENKSLEVSFSSQFIEYFFKINPIVWIVFTSFCISAITIFILEAKTKNLIRSFFIFWFFMLQGLLGVYLLSLSELGENRLTYWYLSLLVLVLWDFLYSPIQNVIREVYDYRYKQRIVVSGIYHFLLFLLILYYDPIVDFFVGVFK